MAQKTNPTGFRLGINKFSKTRWITHSNYYSRVLQDDYQLRQLCKTRLKLISVQIGITKIKIQRNELLLHIRFHVIQPSIIREYRVSQLITNLIILLAKDFKKLATSRLKMEIVRHLNTTHESILIAKALAERLERRISLTKINEKIIAALKKNKVHNYKILISGRLNGQEKARSVTLRKGRLPLQTISADISYFSTSVKIIHGVIGIKVWILRR